MAGKPMEAKKKHNALGLALNGLVTVDSLKKIKRIARSYLEPKTVDEAKDMDEVFHGLEVNKTVDVGEYDKLIDIMTDAGVLMAIDVIQNTAKDIKDIMQNYNPSQKQSETSHPDHHTSSQDRTHPSPGSTIHQSVLNRCNQKLLRNLDFKAICDYIRQEEVVDEVMLRDIEEQSTSSDKIRNLLKYIRQRDQSTYEKFKHCLVLSKQPHLKVHLETVEADLKNKEANISQIHEEQYSETYPRDIPAQSTETDETSSPREVLRNSKARKRQIEQHPAPSQSPCEIDEGNDDNIRVLKQYFNLKKNMSKKCVKAIASRLLDEELINQDEFEKISNDGFSRRVCVDSLLKNVILGKQEKLTCFLHELKSNFLPIAKALIDTDVETEDKIRFGKVRDRALGKMKTLENPHKGCKIDNADIQFFQYHLCDSSEVVDAINDVLLSHFHFSVREHTCITQCQPMEDKIRVLFKKMQLCEFDVETELSNVLESDLHKQWIMSRQKRNDDDCDKSLLGRIKRFPKIVVDFFTTYKLRFTRAEKCSIVLIFNVEKDFTVDLLDPNSLRKTIRDLLTRFRSESKLQHMNVVHLTVFIKSPKDSHEEEIHCYLDTDAPTDTAETNEGNRRQLGMENMSLMAEEMDMTELMRWMIDQLQLKAFTEKQSEDMTRQEKIEIFLDFMIKFENGYELLEKYCEENEKYVYNKVFQKSQQMSSAKGDDTRQEFKLCYAKGGGLQRLFSTWVNMKEDQQGIIKEDLETEVEKQEEEEIEQKTVEEEENSDTNEVNSKPGKEHFTVFYTDGKGKKDSHAEEKDKGKLKEEYFYSKIVYLCTIKVNSKPGKEQSVVLNLDGKGEKDSCEEEDNKGKLKGAYYEEEYDKAGILGSTSTDSVMAGIHTDAMKKKHNELIVYLEGVITKDAFKNIKRLAQTYLPRKALEKASDMYKLFNGLETKGVISVGQYDELIEIMTNAGIIIGIDEIQNTAKKIKDMQEIGSGKRRQESDDTRQLRSKKSRTESAPVRKQPLHTDRDQQDLVPFLPHPTQETDRPLPFEDDPDFTHGPLKVKVENCTLKFYSENQKESYKMTRIPRGKTLIINVNKVAGEEPRQGTDIDRDNLDKLFQQFGFKTIVYNDKDGLTARDIDTKLRKFAAMPDHKEADACVICLLSHGKEWCIYGTDGKTIELDTVFSYFDNHKCEYLREKPKLFIIQACRGGALDKGVICSSSGHDEPDQMKAPTRSDMVICFPTQQGYKAWRNRALGSWYVEALVRVFMEYAKCEDVYTMLNRVNMVVKRKVSHCKDIRMDQACQMSEHTSTLCKPHFYFFPGINSPSE